MFFEQNEQVSKSPEIKPSNTDAQKDRRYFPRWESINKVMYKKDNDMYPHVCLSKDIHCEGLCLKAPEPVNLGEKLSLMIFLESETRPIEAEGRTVWHSSQGRDNLVGIKFERLPSAARESIYKYAFDFQRKDMVKNWFKGW